MMPMSEEAWREMEDERTMPAYGGYGNAMAEEAAWYHAQGLPCPFDCGACLARQEAEYAAYEAEQEWNALAPAERIAYRMASANHRFARLVAQRNDVVRYGDELPPF